jgi:hypothetical protein
MAWDIWEIWDIWDIWDSELGHLPRSTNDAYGESTRQPTFLHT